jgi:hypothetical protein
MRESGNRAARFSAPKTRHVPNSRRSHIAAAKRRPAALHNSRVPVAGLGSEGWARRLVPCKSLAHSRAVLTLVLGLRNRRAEI